MFTLNRTFINSKKMISIVKSLNFYSFNYKFKLNKIFKIMNTLQIDFLIIQKSTKNLFKINMIKKIKKKKSKNYISAFNRVLTKTATKRHRKNEIKKIDLIKQKKSFLKSKNSSSSSKNQMRKRYAITNELHELKKKNVLMKKWKLSNKSK